MPWDVGRTLLQVQWVPRDAEEMAVPAEIVEEEEEEVCSSLSNPRSQWALTQHLRLVRRPRAKKIPTLQILAQALGPLDARKLDQPTSVDMSCDALS